MQWDEGPGAALSEQVDARRHPRAARRAARCCRSSANGDADARDRRARPKVVEAEYVMPLLSHSPLEPMNFTADVPRRQGRPDRPDAVPGRRRRERSRRRSASSPRTSRCKTTFLGGGFGRRIELDFIVQAAQISKAVGKPVKLVWTREDDMTHDFYRPQALHQLAAALGCRRQADRDDVPHDLAVDHRRVFGLPQGCWTRSWPRRRSPPTTSRDTPRDGHPRRRPAGRLLALGQPRAQCVRQRELHRRDGGGRRAGSGAYRMSLLAKQPRFANVLKMAADKAGWGTPRRPGASAASR